MPYKLSVIIPTLDRQRVVLELLQKLERQSYKTHELVVIDQTNEINNELEEYASRRVNLKYVRISEKSLPNARNIGVSKSSGEIVLFLDDDIDPSDDLFKYHVENFANSNIWGVAGKVTGAYDKLGNGPVGKVRSFDARIFRNFSATDRCEVDHLPGGNMSFRREIFNKIGEFDTRFKGASEGEETDFCLRARRYGHKFVYDPRASVFHFRMLTGGVRQQNVHKWFYWNSHNIMLFALRHSPFWSIPTILFTRILSFSIRSLKNWDLMINWFFLLGLLRAFSSYKARK